MTPRNPYVTKRCVEIESLLRDAAAWSSVDGRLGAHLATYISVLLLGVFEDCVEHLVVERLDKAGDQEIKNYVVNAINERFRNPDYSKINELLGGFSQDYKAKFKKTIPYNSPEADALQSVVDSKNSLAHEGICKLNLTVKDAEFYYGRVTPILEALEQILCS